MRNRNNSACAGGVGPSQQVLSKTFENYLKARERVQSSAKSHVDKLNSSALARVKHEKLAAKAARE